MSATANDRVKLIFTLFDVDRNGYLQEDDFSTMADRVVRAAEGSGNTAKQSMKAAFDQYWTTLQRELDENQDMRISFEEYADCVLSPELFEGTVRQFAESLATLGDPDGDGMIERPLFVALMRAIGFDRTSIDTLFDALEPTADDRIRVDAWRAAIDDYYRPEKVGIAGDHLVTAG
jgi:Ca2+-binding EF-hand superfamily protein